MLIKRLLPIFLSIFCLPSAFAVPADPRPIIIVQPDNSTVTCHIRGDELFHFITTDDGIPLVKASDRSMHYAILNQGVLTASDFLAHSEANRTAAESGFINANLQTAKNWIQSRLNEINDVRLKKRAAIHRAAGHTDRHDKPLTGTKRGLVILVNFSDLKFTIPNPREAFNKAFNAEGYNENGHIGSVRDYFISQSYGKFTIDFDVVGPVNVSKEMSYYGKNSVETGSDTNPRKMIEEACTLVDGEVNFRDYDWDGDGVAELVYIVYAGFAESSGAPSNTIWPHQWQLSLADSTSPMFDGIHVNTYACSSELAGNRGSTMSGIGTPCHEFSHCLGLPDIYDVKYSGGVGMSYWDLMSGGSHNGPNGHGEVPCGYSAYERWYVGWLDYTDLNEMQRVYDMPCIEGKPMAYRISNDAFPDEFFVLENRQPGGWFSYAGSFPNPHGLLVTHIDYNENAWNSNSVNTKPSHQRISYIPADGSFLQQNTSSDTEIRRVDCMGDLFPGYMDVREFTDTSHESSGGLLFNPNSDGSYQMHKPVTNIKEYDGLISFDFMGGIFVSTPRITKIDPISDNDLEISWETDGAYDSFILELEEIKSKSPAESRIKKEDFSLFLSEVGTPDGTIDVSFQMDSFMSSPGWTGKNIFTSQYGAKLGSSDLQGYIRTPILKTGSNAAAVKLTVRATSSDCKVSVDVYDIKLNLLKTAILPLSEGIQTIITNFEDLSSGVCIMRISSDIPSYISNLEVFDGNFSEKELSFGNIWETIFNKPEIRTFCDILDSSFVCNQLKPVKYRCHIRAMYEEALSDWSPYMEVDLSSSGIAGTPLVNSVDPVAIYNLSGQRVSDTSLPGIYFLHFGSYAKKIVVK